MLDYNQLLNTTETIKFKFVGILLNKNNLIILLHKTESWDRKSGRIKRIPTYLNELYVHFRFSIIRITRISISKFHYFTDSLLSNSSFPTSPRIGCNRIPRGPRS